MKLPEKLPGASSGQRLVKGWDRALGDGEHALQWEMLGAAERNLKQTPLTSLGPFTGTKQLTDLELIFISK